MSAHVATAAVLAAMAAITGSVAAGPSPEPRDNPGIADLWTICIFTAVFFPFFIMLLAFACLRLFHLPDAPGAGAAAPPPEEESRRGPGGLPAAAIAVLPLVFYRDVRRHRIVGGDGALECSVCLLEFDDDDALRLLPTCPHAFHPECIGLWLERHATCPLCRASLLDTPPPLQPPPATGTPLPADSPSDHPTVVLIGDAGDREDEEDWSRIQCLARNRRAAGRQELLRSNSTGHDVVVSGTNDGSTERFALRLPEHVRVEILMSHRLRHVTSAVDSVRVREGSAHGSLGGSVRSAVARLLSRLAPGAGWKGDGGDKSVKVDAEGATSLRRRENSSRGAVVEEKRSV
ncbi:hypothetical protein PR202_ga01761 [Eleusine coracana subsp. coracana]|uniref:RING-type E3 ubiquitin transferase n=1 Tax=Eleusine coracana subsp. coracana TaxID=191504 RepID=A0AAV5BHZ9_ELECO|nr:hypothetical protein QOZ80_2AG0134800 [Eleusine coracana subsp. coracana]GJM85322.1 hypothetical protein PR202_ga01074 [Eleusine coracana subsp. coracana]GJM85950.1 hypothetical protein PR202_ga01761 [Eleusine coracana subsp. coracana]